MSPKTTPSGPVVDAAARAGARRLQVLQAAEHCFRELGFRGASIHQISQRAGMGPGHIYHYFRNKEAIVAGIVEQRLAEVLERTDALERAGASAGVVEACVEQVDVWIAERAASERAAIELEVLAEAARNDAVAQPLREADAIARARAVQLLVQDPALRRLGAREVAARQAVANTLFDGLAVRCVADPTLDLGAVGRLIKRLMRVLFEETDEATGDG